MTPNDTTKLALKFAGIYMLIQALLYIPTIVSMISMMRVAGQPPMPVAGPITFLIAVGLLSAGGLWFTLGNKPSLEIENPEVITAGIIIGGILVTALALVGLPVLIGEIFLPPLPELLFQNVGPSITVQGLLSILGTLLQLAAGILLVMKAKTITKLIK